MPARQWLMRMDASGRWNGSQAQRSRQSIAAPSTTNIGLHNGTINKQDNKMYLSFGTVLAKYVLFFFNTLVFMIGGSVLGLGAWLALRRGFIPTFLRLMNLHVSPAMISAVVERGAYVLVCAGAMAVVLGFLGCLGTIRESTFLLYMYGLSLIGVLGIQVAAGAYGVVVHRRHAHNLSVILLRTIEEHYYLDEDEDAITFAWNDVMVANGCCGVYNYTDFFNASKWQQEKAEITLMPKHCCHLTGDVHENELSDINCPERPTIKNSYFLKGCLDALKTYFIFPAPVAAPICIGLGLMQVFGIILTLCLCCEMDAVKVREAKVVVWNSEVFFRDKYGTSRQCQCHYSSPYYVDADRTIYVH